MELLSIILSGVLTLISPLGLAIDSAAERSIRERISSAEALEVRLDNTPSYQLLGGKISKLRLAARGLYLTPDFRIDTLELETDPLDVDINRLQQQSEISLSQLLRQPLRGAMRLRITQADANQALRSPAVLEYLRQIGPNLTADSSEAAQRLAQRYQIINPKVEFLQDDRLRLEAEIEDRRENKTLKVILESGFTLVGGRQLQLVQPRIFYGDKQVPQRLLDRLAENLTNRLDIQKFETEGLKARVLQLHITEDGIEIVAWVRLAAPQQATAAR
ncbi:DUF2993 domain-containing protein [[Phormidium] sp. ETS-05]|uniref:LmeA family phospholipid-binding protein n=1 Tax=[Phormidium] sp. ETS-05 TaxID=222819 RepID=UPI0018EEE1F2|nr:DUF2993 domain-containing protein [[Phormidium] sp. ETS-05]